MPPISVDRRTAGLTETASTFTRVSSASGAAAEHLASNGEPLDDGMPDEDPYQDPPEPGYAAVFAEDVEREVRTIRVREQARALIDAERRGPLPPSGSLRDMLARPRPPQARVDGLFPWEASTLILAQRKAGKTTLLLNLSRSLLSGETFLGTFELQPVDGLVALLNYEAAGDTITQWAAEAGLDPDRFLIVNLRGRRNPLADPEDRGRLAELLRQRSTESLLVDPFGRGERPRCSDPVTQNLRTSEKVKRWLPESGSYYVHFPLTVTKRVHGRCRRRRRIGLIAVALGAWLQGRSEHQHWLRDRKLQAATDFVTASRHLLNRYRLVGRQGMDEKDRREWRDRMQAGRSALYLLCSAGVVEVADDLAARLHRTTPETSTAEHSEADDVFLDLVKLLRTELAYHPIKSRHRRQLS